MPSTVVHVAFGALVATALLRAFDARALAAVCAFAALPDLDTFLGLWVPGGHRALLHTALLPLLLGVLVAWDARQADSWLRARFGDRGPHVAGVGVVALAVGGIAPDLMTNGVNVLYPVHDTFYAFDGDLQLSNQRGVVQTFVELSGEEADSVVGTTADVHYQTGVDVARGEDPENAERLFPVVSSGMQLVVVAAAAVAVVGRWRRE
ncbi:metal-dependent hydrolase [Halobacterium jilantaiense]|uniref:LexA-binding, inner membrane-associated putative hydrolase n=1 Tax=Halobacterium jilantaiense TaxID=355548 RepID=A0A1I0QLA7_9EURY|nr:metal-dependent hydrolase [Halobacterium jilantaiense]SEW27859.1 LexA-binding, inner membrane-associated putative hydrolase [Halobacterium jilantaiense]